MAHNLKLLFLKDYDDAVGFFPKIFWISTIFLPLCITNRYLVPDAMLSSVFSSQSSRYDEVGLLELRSRSDKVRGKCQM